MNANNIFGSRFLEQGKLLAFSMCSRFLLLLLAFADRFGY
jgi:hypothetical protein